MSPAHDDSSDVSPAAAAAAAPAWADVAVLLRHVVMGKLAADADVTVNEVRREAERALRVPDGWFAEDASRKARSKAAIRDAADEGYDPDVERERRGRDEEVLARLRGGSSGGSGKGGGGDGGSGSSGTQAAGTKRKARGRGPAKKKSKVSDDEAEDEDGQDTVPKPGKKGERKSAPVDDEDEDEDEDSSTKGAPKPANEGADSSSLSDVESETQEEGTKAAKDDGKNGSDSEMSVLLDEDPAPKRKKRLSSSTDTKSSKSSKANTKTKAKTKTKTKATKDPAPSDPAALEIKKLQTQLGQCGIRKVWGKYLKPYETPRAKIKHLHEMLVEAGMTGRFSQEKARQIREQRELAADLEAVQEGNRYWGKERQSSEEVADAGRPKRKLARGLQGLDFISDGEED